VDKDLLLDIGSCIKDSEKIASFFEAGFENFKEDSLNGIPKGLDNIAYGFLKISADLAKEQDENADPQTHSHRFSCG
jgi:hypothetical protein